LPQTARPMDGPFLFSWPIADFGLRIENQLAAENAESAGEFRSANKTFFLRAPRSLRFFNPKSAIVLFFSP
jgi:hypothetical protein